MGGGRWDGGGGVPAEAGGKWPAAGASVVWGGVSGWAASTDGSSGPPRNVANKKAGHPLSRQKRAKGRTLNFSVSFPLLSQAAPGPCVTFHWQPAPPLLDELNVKVTYEACYCDLFCHSASFPCSTIHPDIHAGHQILMSFSSSPLVVRARIFRVQFQRSHSRSPSLDNIVN